MIVKSMRWAALIMVAASIDSVHAAGARTFTINVAGNDGAALSAALDAARAHRGQAPDDIIVIALPPVIRITQPILLDNTLSGRPDAPLILRGTAKGSVISGAVVMTGSQQVSTTLSPVNRMSSATAAKVASVSLSGLGAGLQPAFVAGSSFKPAVGKLHVFAGNTHLLPARWPATGYAHPQKVTPLPSGELLVSDPQLPAALDAENAGWVDAYWGWDWWFERQQLRIDEAGSFRIAKPQANPKPTARYQLSNVAFALTGHDDYYYDSFSNQLFWIPEPARPLEIAIAPQIIQIRQAQHIRIENVALEKSTSAAVQIAQSTDIQLQDCFVGHSGGFGLVIEGGEAVRIQRCVIDDTGLAGINASGGNPETIAPSGHVFRNNRLSNFGRFIPSYQPAIQINGVAIQVIGNEITDGTHAAVIFRGNNHRIEGNIIHHVLTDTTDAGAIYSGRNWSAWGNAIVGNHFYDLHDMVTGKAVYGVYLDDQLSGSIVENNLFEQVDTSIFIGGGRDNLIRSNLFTANRNAVIRMDDRGLNWQADMAQPGGTLSKTAQLTPERAALYTRTYPGFSTILTDRPGAPINNLLIDNITDRQPLIDFTGKQEPGYVIEKGTVFLTGSGEQAAITAARAKFAKTRAAIAALPFISRVPPAP